MRQKTKPILVLVEPESGREFIYGVHELATAYGWRNLVLGPWRLAEAQGLFPEGPFGGAIIQIRNKLMLTAAMAVGCPLVNVSSTMGDLGLNCCWIDDLEVGRLAARHLLEHGARHFVFVGDNAFYSIGRQVGFTTELEAHGIPLSPERIFDLTSFLQKTNEGLLNELPSALGIFCTNDCIASQTMRECLNGGRKVPDDLAIIGCDNNPIYTHQNIPALSSVKTPIRLQARLATEMLQQLIEEKTSIPRIQTVAPLSVITRGSTEVTMVSDPQITQALQVLRQAGGLHLSVSELSERLFMTRRTLERRFVAAMQKSPADYIRFLRIERTKELLSGSNRTIEEIASEVGYKTRSHLSTAFRKATGMSPGAYRKLRS